MGYDQAYCAEEERIYSELICSICTEIFEDAIVIMKKTCNHNFCQKCIEDSLEHDLRYLKYKNNLTYPFLSNTI